MGSAHQAAQAHLDAPQALVPCKFPPRCFPNPNPGSPCPGADTAPAPPAGVKIDGIVITYNNASAAPAANANAPPPPGLCCQSANTTCPPYPAPDFATTYLPAVGYQVYMCAQRRRLPRGRKLARPRVLSSFCLLALHRQRQGRHSGAVV